jgi:diguanylate cyclase (GGDEF)-like protein
VTLPINPDLPPRAPVESQIEQLALRLERQHALLQSLLGQIDVLISATCEHEMLAVVCTQLLASGLFVHAWVGQTDPELPDAVRIIASGGGGEQMLDQLTAAQKRALNAQIATAQRSQTPTQDHNPYSPLNSLFQDFTPAGWACTTFLMPIVRFDRPWAVLLVGAAHEDALEPILGETLHRLGELLGNALAQFDLRQRLYDEHEHTAYLAYHDALTGLANRRFLDEELPKAMARARRNNQMLAVIMLDLDDFKPINDRWGHAVGDMLLKTLSARLTQTLREADLAVRQGGDEFILLIEGIERKKHLYKTLDRLSQALSAPYALPKQKSIVQASMGVTLFPQDGVEPEQLLRHADAALYICKSKKRNRKNAWYIWNDEATELLDNPDDTHRSPAHIAPYGQAAAVLLQTFEKDIPTLVAKFVDFFYQELVTTDPAAQVIVSWLNPAEFLHLTQRQTAHLIQLLKPELTEAEHRATAASVGRIHALIGVSATSLVRAMTIYLHQFDELLARFRLNMQDLSKLELVLTERLSIELSEELEAEQLINNQYQALLVEIDVLSRNTLSWQEFNERMLALLCQCEGIAACWIGTPNAEGEFIINFGAQIEPFIAAMQQHYSALRMPKIAPGQPEMQGATARAYRLGKIQTIASFSTSPEALPWREAALSIGIRSSIGVPILDEQRRPIAVLTLYGSYPGQFETAFRQAFCQQLGFFVSQTWQQFNQSHTINISIQELDHWRQAFYNHGIRLSYQPVMNLRTGRIEKVEALARLVLADGSQIMPNQFIPRLNESQIIQLFREGLAQGLNQLTQWDAANRTLDSSLNPSFNPSLNLGLSLNLPLEALASPDCIQWVKTALEQHKIPANRLTLEVLEHHEIKELDQAAQQMRGLAELGVTLAMDDLGAGYSSLIRLNNLPFNTVKIDQALIRSVYDDPARIIKFIGALIHMTRALDLEVVAEGLEHPDLIEMAQILGADMGQGYALARPLPPEQIPPLLNLPHNTQKTQVPRSALGAIATHWQMINAYQPPNPTEGAPIEPQHPAAHCPVNQFIINQELQGSALDIAHQALHALEVTGSCHTAEFHHLLGQVQAYLAELVVKPELAP